MCQRFTLFAFARLSKSGFWRRHGEYRTVFLYVKVVCRQRSQIYLRKYEAVGIRCTKFFEEIKSERTSAGTLLVQISDVRIKSNTFESAAYLVCQKRVGEGEERIHTVGRVDGGFCSSNGKSFRFLSIICPNTEK